MKLRRLNDAGIQDLGEFLDCLTTDSPQPWPQEILTDPRTSERVDPDVEIHQRTFSSRFDAAKYLNEQLGDAGIANLERDRGVWAWLALFYFDQVCPPDGAGKRAPGERARWIPAIGDFQKYYRHLLAGPYRIYRAHRDNPNRAIALLRNPVHKPGDIAEQLASRQTLVTNRAAMETATALYIDPSTEQPKRGAAGRGPGSARRLAEVLEQFDVTWDLYSMDAAEMLAVLPGEFDKFRPRGP